MELAKVIGTVVATRKNHKMKGLKLLVIQPVDENLKDVAEPLIAVDSRSCAPGQIVSWVGGREASMAFEEQFIPVDAGIVSIVDRVDPE